MNDCRNAAKILLLKKLSELELPLINDLERIFFPGKPTESELSSKRLSKKISDNFIIFEETCKNLISNLETFDETLKKSAAAILKENLNFLLRKEREKKNSIIKSYDTEHKLDLSIRNLDIKFFEYYSENQDYDSLSIAAFCYENGIGVEKDSSKAEELYKKISSEFPQKTQKDLEKNTFESYAKLSAQQDSKAKYAVGLCHLIGVHVEKNPAIADKIFNDLREELSVSTADDLDKKMLKYFSDLADIGNIHAKRFMRFCYEKGVGVEKNPQKAAQLFEDLKFLTSELERSMLDETLKNYQKLLSDLQNPLKNTKEENAADLKEKIEKAEFAIEILTPIDPAKKIKPESEIELERETKMFEVFKKLGDQGDENAKWVELKCHRTLASIDIDFERSFTIFKYLEKQHSKTTTQLLDRLMFRFFESQQDEQPEAKYAVQFLLKHKIQFNTEEKFSQEKLEELVKELSIPRVEDLHQKMFKYFESRSKQEDLDSRHIVSLCYQNGVGTKKDERKAKDILEELLKPENERFGEEEIRKFDKNLTLESWKEYEKAVKYYEGDGCKQDTQKAKTIFAKLAATGISKALEALNFIQSSDKPSSSATQTSVEKVVINSKERNLE